VVCTTDPKKGDESITLIYVPPDAEGLSFGKPEPKLGLIYTDTNTSIYFDNVRVPKEYCVGKPGGEGARLLHECLTMGRASDGGTALGPAQAALEVMLDFTKNRHIKGKPVRERSMHAGIIGEMAMKLQAARYNYLTTAWMLDHPDLYGPLSSLQQLARASASKVFSTQTALSVIGKCMELMGSYGASPNYKVEKYLRDIWQVHLWLGGVQLSLLDSARRFYYFEFK
jgi:alkylation response protein AidB-like acyl-CoA dehydrogenase